MMHRVIQFARHRVRLVRMILGLTVQFFLPNRVYLLLHDWLRHQPRALKKDLPYQAILDRNIQLRNIHQKDKRCFVVGAGPSLRSLNTELLRDEVIIGVNAAYLDSGIQQARRKYWCLIDYFMMETTPEIIEVLRAIEANVGDAIYFFPIQARPICEKNQLFKEKKIFYFVFDGFLGSGDRPSNEHFDLTRTIPQPHGTTETALVCAAYMGFKHVYMIGVDSDWFAYRHTTTVHFYNESENPHAIDNKIKNWIDFSRMESKLYYGYLLYRSYRLLGQALRIRGVNVYNASGGGLLDVFPLADYESLFTEQR